MQRRFGSKLPMPVLALGGEGGVGTAMLRSMELAGSDVSGCELIGCGHFLPEEFTSKILEFWKDRCLDPLRHTSG